PQRSGRPPGPLLPRHLLRPAMVRLQPTSPHAHLDGHNASYLVREGSSSAWGAQSRGARAFLGNAGGHRAGAAKRLCRKWARACVRLLFSDLSDGLLAHVGSGGTIARRSDALHHLADHIMGRSAETYSHAIRAPCCPTGIQERISGLVVSPAQAIEGSRRGERIPYSSCHAAAASISSHPVSGQDRAWKERPAHRGRPVAPPARGAAPLPATSGRGCRSHGDLCRYGRDRGCRGGAGAHRAGEAETWRRRFGADSPRTLTQGVSYSAVIPRTRRAQVSDDAVAGADRNVLLLFTFALDSILSRMPWTPARPSQRTDFWQRCPLQI